MADYVELTHVASWRDMPFPCMSVNGRAANALQETTYPHREGAQVDNLGRLGEAWEVEAVFTHSFNGMGPYPSDLWPHGWMRFYDALKNERERGWFDHPYFGRAWAQVASFAYDVDNRHSETLRCHISFRESNLDEPTYDLVLSEHALTEGAAANRAGELDILFRNLYPYANESPFSDLWAAYILALMTVDSVLTYDDAEVACMVLNKGLTTILGDFPLILDPVNWRISSGVSIMRHDATVIAQRFAGEGRRVVTWENRVERSALEIVVDLYNDATREQEFLDLNGSICDPLTVQPGIYRVYTDINRGDVSNVV